LGTGGRFVRREFLSLEGNDDCLIGTVDDPSVAITRGTSGGGGLMSAEEEEEVGGGGGGRRPGLFEGGGGGMTGLEAAEEGGGGGGGGGDDMSVDMGCGWRGRVETVSGPTDEATFKGGGGGGPVTVEGVGGFSINPTTGGGGGG
jgi:hypothetical protein